MFRRHTKPVEIDLKDPIPVPLKPNVWFECNKPVLVRRLFIISHPCLRYAGHPGKCSWSPDKERT